MTARAEAKRIEKAIEKILASSGTKADKARALYDLGAELPDVVDLLDMNYSQAHSIRKKMRVVHVGPDRSARDAGSVVRADRSEPEETVADGDGYPPLHLSPSQTRYAFHNDHWVVRVDTRDGPRCGNCDSPVVFTVRHLAFVHRFSEAEPQYTEDHYVQ